METTPSTWKTARLQRKFPSNITSTKKPGAAAVASKKWVQILHKPPPSIEMDFLQHF